MPMHYYSFHPGDYLRDTAHLTNEEDLAYRRLLDFYHQSELPIPAETQMVSRRLRLGLETVNQVLSEFFELREDGWHQARCDAAIAEYQRRCGVNREVGKLGGRPKKTQTVSTQNPDGFHSKPRRNPNHKPETNNQKPITRNQSLDAGASQKSAKRERKAKPIDDEHLAQLQSEYPHAKVRDQFAACTKWWLEKKHCHPSRAALKNWLNKVQPPPVASIATMDNGLGNKCRPL